ncbi:Uncharacterised protein [uncultured Clostridium sp.]|nr:Uncharacterised protein [uncultured Clostridium sp.]
MGVYRAAIVTENGQNLIAQALANEKPLIFTSAKTSSYSYPVGTDVPALTGLQDVVQSVLPFDSKVLGGNVAQVSVRFDNDGVDQTYRIETIGLYAKIEGGAETLFSVTQATTPDEMPVQSDISPSAYIYNIQHTVQNASQITLTVNPAGTATVQDIMDIESPEFDDSGTVEGISSFPSFLETMKSKMNFFQFFRNLKAGLQFVLHTGQIVNNCVTDNSSLPLSAAQGKVLKDLYTQLYSDMGKKISIGGEMIGGYVNWQKSDGRFATIIIDTPDGPNQLILEKNSAAVTILRNNTWQEQYRLATISMLSDYVLKSDLVVSSAALQSKQNVTDESYIKFYKYGKIVVAHITVTTTSEVSGYNVLKLGVIPNGFRPNFECRSLILRQQSNESRILAFTTSGDINLWNWSTNAGITTPSGSSFCGEAVFCVA